MGRLLRISLPSLAILTALLVALSLLGWWTLHTSWFMNLVRTRIVALAEQATGGRVDLGNFSFDANTLTAQIDNFVIHGTEPAGAPPLLSVEKLQVGLEILSLWRRDINLQSLHVNRPAIHLIISADGSTNMPSPKTHQASHNQIQQLLDLKIQRTEIHDGLISVNDNKTPFELVSDHLELALNYNRVGPSYDLSLSLPSTDLKLRKTFPPRIAVFTTAHLFRNRLQFDSLKISSGSSNVSASGALEDFNHPSGDFQLAASFAVDDLAARGRLRQLQGGTAAANGTLHIVSQGWHFAFAGKLQARDVNYVSRSFTLRRIDADGDVIADNGGVSLKKAVVSARGAKFTGEGSIKNYRSLQVQGRVSGVSLRDVGAYLTDQPFPWAGVAAGTAFASATLLRSESNFIIGAQVQITPEAGAIPISGDVGVTYFNQTSEIQFARSELTLPHSQLRFDGTLNGDLNTIADTADFADLKPLLPIIGARFHAADIPVINSGGHVHFNGVLHNLDSSTVISGGMTASSVSFRGQTLTNLRAKGSVASTGIDLPAFELKEAGATASGSLSLGLLHWSVVETQPLQVSARFSDLNVVRTAALLSIPALPVVNGVASGAVNLHGTLADPKGTARFRIANLGAYGEQINQIVFDATLNGALITIAQGRVQAGPAQLSFSGDYRRNQDGWSTGEAHLRADTNGFPLASLSTVHKYLPGLTAQAEAHFDAGIRITSAGMTPLRADGAALLRKVTINGITYGEAALAAVTRGTSLSLSYAGELLQTAWRGKAQAKLIDGTPIQGDVRLSRLDFATLKTLAPAFKAAPPVNGYLEGGLTFDGSLEKPERMRAELTIDQLQIGSPLRVSSLTAPKTAQPKPVEIALRNKAPVVIQASNGVARFESFEITGNDTSITVTGDAQYTGKRSLNVKAVGKANLQMFSLFDSNVQSSGDSEIAVNIAGTLGAPTVTGALEVTNGSFFLTGVPNGLSDVNGTVVFTRNRATIQKMTAHSGGGELSLAGFVSFGAGSRLVYHVEGMAQNVRVRYANSISVTANSDLRLSGTSASSILSGNLTITRVVFTPNADVGNILAGLGASPAASGDEGDFLTGLHFDVAVESAPNLEVSTNLSRDVEAEIQLRLRGTSDHPILLGSIAANQGDIRVFGTRYSLNRGEVSFVNTVKAEPVLDLDLETQTRGVTVDITISGTPSKLNVNYRSDPPLQPRDIIALLTVGRAPEVGTTSNVKGAGDVSALKSGVNSVVGQAISPVSNRLSRLFGIANIRIDPFVQGITNTPQARLSVEQQISRDITITYVTNLSQTSEQIFRLEWALNRQFSIIALRDDNGEFGIDIQYKKRFK